MLRAVLVVLAVLASTVLATPASAAPTAKVRIDYVAWIPALERFEVGVSAQRSLVGHGLSLEATLVLRDGSGAGVGTISSTVLLVSQGTPPDADRFLTLIPASVPWDRNGGTFAGALTVEATVSAQTSDGRERAHATDMMTVTLVV